MEGVVQIGGHASGLGTTQRRDTWWVGPLLTVFGIFVLLGYMTWAAFQGDHYYTGPYLSPLYEPLLFIDGSAAGSAPVDHAWIGGWPAWWPDFLPVSPALLILAFPGAFRATCYYYRKAYYRSFSATPPGCAVGALKQNAYKGETRLLVVQNLHRYAMYFALLYIPILALGAFRSFFHDGEFGVGVGSLVLTVNAVLLTAFTLGCHAWRHLIGGKLDCFSCDAPARMRYKAWSWSSWLNGRHQLFAWVSFFVVASADLYVRLVSMGVITDLNTWS
jgi:hypothetical protein